MRKANILDEVQQRDVEKIKNIDFIQSTKLTTAAAEELTKVPNNFHDENLLKKSFRKMLQAIIKKGVLSSQTCQKFCLSKPNQSCHSSSSSSTSMLDRVASIISRNKRMSSVDGEKCEE